ncbi:protein MFI isoform 2, partial [Daubentonia madagascariensis]
ESSLRSYSELKLNIKNFYLFPALAMSTLSYPLI